MIMVCCPEYGTNQKPVSSRLMLRTLVHVAMSGGVDSSVVLQILADLVSVPPIHPRRQNTLTDSTAVASQSACRLHA